MIYPPPGPLRPQDPRAFISFTIVAATMIAVWGDAQMSPMTPGAIFNAKRGTWVAFVKFSRNAPGDPPVEMARVVSGGHAFEALALQAARVDMGFYRA